MLRITALDHVVLAVDDVERTLAWYRDELGLEALREDDWRRGDAPFPSVRVDRATIIDIVDRDAGRPLGPIRTNMDHLCLVTDTADLAGVVASGRFEVVEGPVDRWGARGMARSIYVRDPDGNVVEIRHYPPVGP